MESKKEELRNLFVEKIHTVHASDNELIVGCYAWGEMCKEGEDYCVTDQVDMNIIFNLMDVITSGITDKKYLKSILTKYIKKL